jgi:hypothetical protein
MRDPGLPRTAVRLLLAVLLGIGAAVLVSCGSSGKGLIPAAQAGPLQSDFLAVAQAAREGDGSCQTTEVAIHKTEHDLRTLPSSVDSGLRGRLEEGVANLSARARVMCTQPLSPTTTSTTGTSTTSTTRTAPTRTSPTATSTTEAPPTETTETTATAPTGTAPPPTATQQLGTGGGAQAPGDEGQGAEDGAGSAAPGGGNGNDRGDGNGNAEGGPGGGTGVGQ